MKQVYKGEWLIVDWISYVFAFHLVESTGNIKIVENVDTLEISVVINNKEISLGTLTGHAEQNLPIAVSFSSYGAGPNIRFKFMNVDVTRQVPIPMLANTAFHIICSDDSVAAVMITDMQGEI